MKSNISTACNFKHQHYLTGQAVVRIIPIVHFLSTKLRYLSDRRSRVLLITIFENYICNRKDILIKHLSFIALIDKRRDKHIDWKKHHS